MNLFSLPKGRKNKPEVVHKEEPVEEQKETVDKTAKDIAAAEETKEKEETNNAEEEEPEAKEDSNATSSSHEKTPEEIANAVSNVFFVSPGHFINL